jgi:hypothetical protein
VTSFTDPAFTDPQSAWDWFAVVAYSVALLALAAGLMVFARLVGGRVTVVVASVAAAGAVVTAVGNLVEDALGHGWAGDALYLPGAVLMLLGLVGLPVAVAVEGRGAERLFALVPASTLVGLLLLERGGGILILAAWLGLAIVVRRTNTAEPVPSIAP